ncbi:MAG: acyl--CoA ligase, partial [Chloroflexi bacterium]|nr:acyl--CoA ligase [Chloroflexota bacterium]
MYIGDYLGRQAIYLPDRVAVVDAGRDPHCEFTYAQLNDRANRTANWLRDQVGVGQGDRVAILAHNGVEFLDTFFACGKLGAILTCLNWRLHWRELLQLIAQTAPKALIFSEAFSAAIEQIAAKTPIIQQYLHIEGDSVAGSTHFETALQSAPATAVTTGDLTEADIACLIFTGGTTGLPKAAQVSHRMIAWNTLNTIIHDLTHGDVTVNVFPMFHTGGLLVYTTPLLILGGTVILTRRFDA